MSKVETIAGTDEAELERLDDAALAQLVSERANQPTIPVCMQDLSDPSGASEEGGSKAEEIRCESRVVLDPVGWVPPAGDKRPETVTRHTENVRMASFSEITATRIDQGGAIEADDFVYVDISSVDNKLKRIVEPKTLAVSAAPSRARQRLRTGDVLVSMTRPNLNAVAMVPQELDGAVGSTGFHVLRATETTDPHWLYYAVQAQSFVSAMSGLVQGALYPAVRPKDIRAFQIPHPPLDQQKRIVAEIEKHTSRLDEAVANLKRVKANLKRYKAAVLKAAVEGRLVETEAALAHREGRSYETGEQLLQRILETRRSQWQGKGKYKEPATPDTTDLPELPEGWVWASLDQLTSSSLIGLDRGRGQQNSEGVGVPYVKMNKVTMEGDVTSDDMVYVAASDDEKQRFNLQIDDLLFNTRNSKELVGKVGIVHSLPKGAIYNNNLMRLRLIAGAIPGFICSQMCSDGFRRRMELVKKATTNVAAVYAKDLFPLPLALPSIEEQHRIVAEVDRHLSLLRETEAQVDANLQRAERLRQSVLSRAFSCKLAATAMPGNIRREDAADAWSMAAEPLAGYGAAS